MAASTHAFGTVYFFEEFYRSLFTNDATPEVAPPPGWVIKNNSSSIGDRSWFGGAPGSFQAFSGIANDYAAVSSRSGAGLADISN